MSPKTSKEGESYTINVKDGDFVSWADIPAGSTVEIFVDGKPVNRALRLRSGKMGMLDTSSGFWKALLA
jgi:hypothetical protein